MVGAARGVNDQGRALHPCIAAVKTGSNGRVPFPSAAQALAGLVEGWGSARGVNSQGRVLHLSVAAVETGSNGRAPFSSTRTLAGLVAGWTSLAENEMQGFSSESSGQGAPMSCRSQERSEDGLGRSGRCRLARWTTWHGIRRHCGWQSYVMSTTFAPPPPLLLLPLWLRLIRLMSASLLVVLLSASPVLLMCCLKLSAVRICCSSGNLSC